MNGLPPRLDVLIAGVAKAGTTTLFHALSQHPAVCGANVKEMNFLLRDDWMEESGRRYFASCFQQCAEPLLTLEASPRYWFHPDTVLPRLGAVGSPKVIIVLRDPAKRLWSSFTYLQSRSRVSHDMRFSTFIEACQEHSGPPDSPTAAETNPLDVGVYSRFLPRWLEALGDDIRVCFAENLFADAVEGTRSVAQWLRLPGDFIPDVTTTNATRRARSSTLARLTWSTRPLAVRLLQGFPRIRQRIRQGYEQINTGPLRQRMLEEDRLKLVAYYEHSNVSTRALLEKRGYIDLPPWLADAGRPVQQEIRE